VSKIAATIKDVAKYTGLSIATISKYINGGNVLEQNKALIDNAINILGFKVNEIARGLKTNKTMTIGVLIPSLENIFSTTIISCVENILMESGYSTIICDYKHNSDLEKNKFDFLLQKAVDGIIIMPQDIDKERIEKALAKNIPVILIDRTIKGLDCDVVLVDNLNASYNAVEHLISKGHKRIGIICGPQSIYTAQERLKGYYRVFEDYNLPVDEDIIRFGDYEVESGYSLLNQLLDNDNPPTAIYVTNYEMTLGAVMAINERNIKVPEEISIIGFDNIELAKVVKPTLSIVVQPMELIGETSANLLLKRLKGDNGNFPLMFRLKTELQKNESVKAV
jgi:Transcriptional regulators